MKAEKQEQIRKKEPRFYKTNLTNNQLYKPFFLKSGGQGKPHNKSDINEQVDIPSYSDVFNVLEIALQ